MRIAVISPHARNNGTTTLAMLIAMSLADSGKKTCITHVKPTSPEFNAYLNFSGYQDKTSSPSQIVKILREGGIASSDVSDYCKRVTDDLEAFTNSASNFTQDDMNFMLDYAAKSFPHEHLVFDVDDDSDDRVKHIISLCDVVVLNVTQSINEATRFKNNHEKYMEMIGDKPVVTVVNKCNGIKGNISELAHSMGIKKPNNWLLLHENPWIVWGTNHGKLTQIFSKIKSKDIRVVELNRELYKITTTLIRAKLSKSNKKSGGHR